MSWSFIIFPILGFILQSYTRLLNKYFGVDVWTRMIEADLIRKNRHRIPMQKIKNNFIIEGYFNYPTIFPWLLSFIPKKVLFNVQGFIAPIFDAIQNFLVAIIAFQLTGRLDVALFAQLIYLSIPLIVLENSYLTPRSLGYLNFTLAFYFLLLYSVSPSINYLIAAFIFTTLIFFTHKFATQSLFFITIFFSIFEKNPLYILVFTAGLVTAFIISKGYYLRILGGHIGNIYFWMKNYDFRFAHQVRGVMSKNKKTDFVGLLYNLLHLFSPLALIASDCWLVFPLIFLFVKIPNLLVSGVEYQLLTKLSVATLFFYVFSILVLSIKYLIPIGEGQRYLEMVTAPASIISSIIFFSLLSTPYKELSIAIFALLLIVNFVTIFYLQYKGVINDKNRSLTKDMNQVFNYLDKIKPKARILCIPHQITTLVLYNTNTQVLVDIESGTLQKISDVFPILKSPIGEIAKKYDLNTLVLKKDYATMGELGLKQESLLFEVGDVQVIKI